MEINMDATLDDKVTAILCASISGAACAAGGLMLGWAKAKGISIEYEALLYYGPSMLSAGMFAARGGVEAYSQAIQEPRLTNPLSFAGRMALGNAVMGVILGGYNQICFAAVGYIAGKISEVL
ncbi:hypothetical protein HYU08_01835 [Candidatus Woesearchaeota archaeon]|nr:hypothetical protein [Candidatus Woesearchaeota archaeon]